MVFRTAGANQKRGEGRILRNVKNYRLEYAHTHVTRTRGSMPSPGHGGKKKDSSRERAAAAA